MRPLSRRHALALLGVGSAALTGACSQGGASPSPSAPAGSPGAGGSASPSAEPVQRAGQQVDGPTLRIWADAEFVPRMIEASEPFVAEYQVNLEFQPLVFNDIQTQFAQAAPGGSGPDIIDAAVDWVAGFNQAGLLAPLTLGDKVADFDERAIGGMTQNDTLYGLPLTVESINIWRNTELVPEPVTSWEQMAEVAERLLGEGVRYPFAMENDPTNAYLFIGMLTAFGGYCFGGGESGQYDISDVGLDNAGSVAALDWLDQAVKNEWTRPGITGDIASQAFLEGQAGVELAGPWRLATYRDQVEYAIDPLPEGPGGPARPFLGCRGLMVNANSPQVALAQTFLTEFWATEAPMRAFAESTAKESAFVPVKESASDPDIQAFISASENAEIIPTDPALAAYWPAVGGAMSLIYQQDATAEEAMTQAAQQVREAAEG